MQLISEAYALMTPMLSAKELSEMFGMWNQGELNSFLMEITSDILSQEDKPGMPIIDVIDDVADQKGTGMWTAQVAINLGVDASLLIEALLARFASASPLRRLVDMTVDAPQALADKEFIEDVRRALYVGKIVAYAQGFQVIDAASDIYAWDINKAQLALTWREGCIIRADFLDIIAKIFTETAVPGALLLSEPFVSTLAEYLPSLRRVVAHGVHSGVATPAFSAALAYLDTLRADRLPTALVQAQRDYFGAHGFRRIDSEGVFHRQWQAEV